MAHDVIHAVDSANHTIGSLTTGKLAKVGDGTPPLEDSTNTDAEVAAAVTASHAKVHPLGGATDHTPIAGVEGNLAALGSALTVIVDSGSKPADFETPAGAQAKADAAQAAAEAASDPAGTGNTEATAHVAAHDGAATVHAAGTTIGGLTVANIILTTTANYVDLTDGGATTLHTHAAYLLLAGGTMTGLVTDFGANLKVVDNANISSTPLNDWNPTGLATAGVLKLDTDDIVGTVTITGITAQAEGRVLVLFNRDTSASFVLSNADALSAAANQFLMPASITIAPYAGVILCYLNSRWRCIGQY